MKKLQLSVKDHKIVKGKLEGKTSKEIAKEVYPDTKSGDVRVRQRLQNSTLQAALRAEMARQGITLEKIVKPITEALNASEAIYDKQGNYVDEKINHTVRLQASDRAAKYLGIDKAVSGDNSSSTLSPEELAALASESDEMVLTQLVFKKPN